jgi:hypothetical protein
MQGYEQQMRNRLADVLLNPKLTADIMNAANDPGRMFKLIQSIPNTTTRQLAFDAVRGVPAMAGVGLATSANR